MERARTNSMAIAAVVMSVLSVLLASNLIFAMMAGAMGITFALLSRGDGSMSTVAKVALFISIAGIIASIVMTIYMTVAMINSGAMDYYMQIFEDSLREQYY